MLRLKATKTSLYKLISEYVPDLPPMKAKTQFTKYHRAPDYALDWTTKERNCAHAFFAGCMGQPLLSIEIKDGDDNHTISRTVHTLDIADLRRRGMVEEFVPAAERRATRGTV